MKEGRRPTEWPELPLTRLEGSLHSPRCLRGGAGRDGREAPACGPPQTVTTFKVALRPLRRTARQRAVARLCKLRRRAARLAKPAPCPSLVSGRGCIRSLTFPRMHALAFIFTVENDRIHR